MSAAEGQWKSDAGVANDGAADDGAVVDVVDDGNVVGSMRIGFGQTVAGRRYAACDWDLCGGCDFAKHQLRRSAAAKR